MRNKKQAKDEKMLGSWPVECCFATILLEAGLFHGARKNVARFFYNKSEMKDINGYLLRFYRSDIVVAGLVPAKRYLSLRDDIICFYRAGCCDAFKRA
jgi:hypothetical protein